MKTSQVFRAAKTHLYAGRGRKYRKPKFICHALDRVWGLADDADVAFAKNVIKNLLGRQITLEDWLLRNGHVKHNDLYGKTQFFNRAKMQATRHAWLDHLIQHYESIGQ